MSIRLELGLDTFGDVTTGPDGHPLPHAQVIRNVIDEAVLADDLGIDFFGVGEHHRADFAISSPEVLLAAIAASRTSGDDTAKSARWCSPTPKKSMPRSSARTASSMTWRMTWACGSGWPSRPVVTSPKVSSPSSRRVDMLLTVDFVTGRACVIAVRSGFRRRSVAARRHIVSVLSAPCRCGFLPTPAGRRRWRTKSCQAA